MSDDLNQRVYPEDEHLHRLQEDPDRRMTRAEWEHEESLARQAAHKKHEQVQHDREVQEEFDRKKRSKHRNWKKIFPWAGGGLLLLLLIFLIGYLPRHERNKKLAAEAKQKEEEEPQVEVVQVKRTKAPGELTVPGTTAPLTEAFIYARANGYVRKRFVDIGDRVKRGQLLALIDAPDLDEQVAQAREQLRQAEAQETQQQAQLALANVTWQRYSRLVAKGVFSRQDGDQSETNYRAQVAVVSSMRRNVESYRANLDRMISLQRYERITAPFDGIVTQRNADIGALVGTSGAASSAPMLSAQNQTSGSSSQGSSNTSGSTGSANQSATPMTGEAQGGPIFAIAESDKLRVLVSVPEGYAHEIAPGMPARVFIQERNGQPITAAVTRIATSLDQNTRTMLTEVDLDNRDGSFNPGMYAVVSFLQVRGVAPLVVPGDAIVIRQDRTTVAVVKDQKVEMVPVQIGRDYGPTTEVVSGLQEGDWVITSVTDTVQPGVKVHTHQASMPGEENSSQGGDQTRMAPDSGPNQYGDQSIVNSETESTTQKGKPGQGQKGQSGGQGGKSGQDGKQSGQKSGQQLQKQQQKVEKKGSSL